MDTLRKTLREALLLGLRAEKSSGNVFAAMKDVACEKGDQFKDYAKAAYDAVIEELKVEGRAGVHQTPTARGLRATISLISGCIEHDVFDPELSKGKLAAALKAAKAAANEDSSSGSDAGEDEDSSSGSDAGEELSGDALALDLAERLVSLVGAERAAEFVALAAANIPQEATA